MTLPLWIFDDVVWGRCQFYERIHEFRLAKLLVPVGDELAEETAAAVAAAAAAAAAAFDP